MQHETLPKQLASLGPCQREIADIVYASCAATPRDVQGRLSDPRSVRVVRTLLDRMVAKGMLKRRHSGRHNELIYVPAIMTPRVREKAVRSLVRDQFAGSMEAAEAAIAELARRESQVPRDLISIRRRFEQAGATTHENLRGGLNPNRTHPPVHD